MELPSFGSISSLGDAVIRIDFRARRRRHSDLAFLLPFDQIWCRYGPYLSNSHIPDGWDKVNSGIGLSCRPARLRGWQTGTTTLCRSQLLYIPPVRDDEFDYRQPVQEVVATGIFTVMEQEISKTSDFLDCFWNWEHPPCPPPLCQLIHR
jgi:hypothetical protein